MPAATALIVTLVLDGDFCKMAENVLHLGIRSAAAFAAKIVQPGDLVHEEIDDSDDDL